MVQREERRLAALARYRILDTAPEAAFDAIVKIAAQICGTPMALISLVDDRRQWFKAAIGIDETETPRDIAFCAHAIEQEGVFEVADATQDRRFADNPLVTDDPNLRAYAGAPLVTADGHALGTLCVLDRVPRVLTEAQREALTLLADQVVQQLELRRVLADRHALEERQRLILESAVEYAIISMDMDGIVTSWNAGAERITGWSEAEMLGQTCDCFFTEEDQAAGVPLNERKTALRNGRAEDERWHVRQGGERFWGSGEMMPLTGDDGAPIGFLKIFRDETRQRESTERLAASEQRFQLALGAANFVGAWDWDFAADLIFTDQRFAAFYSVDPERAARGLPLAAFVAGIHPDDRDWVSDEIARTVETRDEFDEEYRLQQVDGTVVWVRARGRCVTDEAGNPTHFPGVAVEITDRRAMEDALRASETRTRLALEAADMGAWETTPDFSLHQWDARTRVLLGHEPDETGDFHSVMDRVHPDDRARVEAEVLRVAGQPQGVLDIDYRVVNRTGSVHWVHVRGRVIAEQDAPARFVGTIRDVTQQKSAEERGKLLAGELQHRIKNTLAVVQSIVGQTLRNAASPEEARDAVSDRLATFGRAHDLLNGSNWTSAGLREVLESAVEVHGVRNDRITLDGPEVRLTANAALAFSMAVHELSTNAVKYGALSTEAGRVELRWARVERDGRWLLDFSWQESGGPAVTAPKRGGFGSRLMRGLGRDLGGEGVIDYAAAGVRWSLEADLDKIEDRVVPAAT